MRQILHSYQLRLTNLSQGNRALRLLRLSARRHIDLKDLAGLEHDQAEDLLRKRIAGRSIRLINQLDPRFAPVNQADRQLTYLYRSVNRLFEETGTYDLFIGYPFIEGRFVDGTVVRCPVLLFPVSLERNLQGRPRWQLQIPKADPVTFNRTLFLAYEHFQQLRLPAEFWEDEIDPNSDWQTWLHLLHEKLKAYEVQVNMNPRLFDQELKRFPNWTKGDTEHLRPGVLTFHSQAVLGIFPQSDSALLGDYETIMEQPEAFGLTDWLSPNDMAPAPSPDLSYVKEEDRYYVTPVDQSQEEAMLAVKQGESLVVHGPPGTGKSQVIVNLIADALAHGHRVLLVSQKRAALDVVYQRLQGIGLARFAVLVHDFRHDRAAIYQQIRRQIDDIPHFQAQLKDLQYTKEDHDHKVLARQLDQLGRTYDDLFDALTKPQPFGRTVHDLYQNTPHELARLPVGEVAAQLTQASLDEVLHKLRQWLDYRDLLTDTHPWVQRLSFRHMDHDAQQRLGHLLSTWSTQLTTLDESYQTLSPHLSTRLLEVPINQERIEAFRTAHTSLMEHQVREGMEALNGDDIPPARALERLSQWEEALTALDKRQWLDDGYWKLYHELVQHAEAYATYQHKGLRVLSLAYHRARWFWRKVLAQHGQTLDAHSFAQLAEEVAAFQQLNQLYAEAHELRFFEDFSLLGAQSDKWVWLKRKRRYAEAYAQVRGISFFRKIKPRFVHGQVDQLAWNDSMRMIDQLTAFTQTLQSLQEQWQAWLPSELVEGLATAIKSPAEWKTRLGQMASSLEQDFEDLRDLDQMLGGLSAVERKLFDALRPQLPAPHVEAETAWLIRVAHSVQAYWIEQAEQRHPVLREVSSRGWIRQQKRYQEGVAERRQQVRNLLQRRLMERIVGIIRYNRLRNPITYRAIRHQVSKQRRLWSVRKLVRETWRTGLAELVPCWMASPESVAAIFPMQKDFFDLVIFDEASQCLVERALPVVLRGKQCVIAGDNKQLRPYDLYRVRYEESEETLEAHGLTLEVESILDLAQNRLPAIRLNWHYRSQEEALINFSNHAFYEGSLQVMPPAKPDLRFRPVLEWVPVAGQWVDNQNHAEAQHIIELVLHLITTPDPPSLGIVTMNYRQQQLIGDYLDDQLEQMARSGDSRYNRLHTYLHRPHQQEAWEGLFIKNIENVQGDERDVILFSIGYAANERGKLSTNFGLLNQKGGENRLNVAISRARRKIFVVCSFLPHELKVEGSSHEGPRYFRDYLAYVKAISDGEASAALRLLDAQNDRDLTQLPAQPIVDQIAERLIEQGYVVQSHFGDTAYKLALVVKAKATDATFLLGIEVEGAYFFSGASSKEREVYRPSLLQQRGWPLYRVWARNWWRDPAREMQNILDILTPSSPNPSS